MSIYQGVRKDMIHVTEYSSMLHDMVHGHMLYDTVDFVLNQKDVPEIDLLAEVSPYLMNRSDCIGNDGLPYVRGKYKGIMCM